MKRSLPLFKATTFNKYTMDKSYATPDLAKMTMYWGFDRPCSAGVTVKAPVLYAERETLDSVPDGVVPIPTLEQIQRWLREEKKVNVYCFGIWRSEKR